MLVAATADAFNPIEFWRNLPRTAQEAKDLHAAAHPHVRMAPADRLHLQHRAHHAALRVRANRAKLGLYIPRQSDEDPCAFFPDSDECQNANNQDNNGANDNTENVDGTGDVQNAGQSSLELLDGFLGNALGFASSLQTDLYSSNPCFNQVENTILGFDSLFNSLQYIYMPWYWSRATQDLTDSIVLQSAIWEECDINKGVETASSTFSQEGFTQLLVRISSGMAYELPDFDTIFSAKSGYEAGKIFGDYARVTLNWSI